MQDFSPQGQDGVRCLVVAFLLLRSFVLRFPVHYRRLAFSRACRTARTSGKRTRDRRERGVDRRRRKRPISATTTTRKPTTMQITASVSVWAIGCSFFAMKKAIRPPGRRRSLSLLFFCSDLPLRSASQSIIHAQIRRNRANIGTGTRWGPPNQLAHFLCEF